VEGKIERVDEMKALKTVKNFQKMKEFERSLKNVQKFDFFEGFLILKSFRMSTQTYQKLQGQFS